MRHSIQAPDVSEWQAGLDAPLCQLQYEPSELGAMLGLEFKQSVDDLGEFDILLLQMRSGKQYGLKRYHRGGGPGTQVLTNWFTWSIELDFLELLAALKINREAVVWVNDEMERGPYAIWIGPYRKKLVRAFGLFEIAHLALDDYQLANPEGVYSLEQRYKLTSGPRVWIPPDREFPPWVIWRVDSSGEKHCLNSVPYFRSKAERLLQAFKDLYPHDHVFIERADSQ